MPHEDTRNSTNARARRGGHGQRSKRCHFEESDRSHPHARSVTDYPSRAAPSSSSATIHGSHHHHDPPPSLRKNRSLGALDSMLDSHAHPTLPRRHSPQGKPLHRNRPPMLDSVMSSSFTGKPKSAVHRTPAKHKATPSKRQRKFGAPFSEIASVLAAAAHLIIVENRERREGVRPFHDAPDFFRSGTIAHMVEILPTATNQLGGALSPASQSPASAHHSPEGATTSAMISPDPGSSTTRRFDVPALPPLESLPPSMADVRNPMVPQPRSRLCTPTPRSRRQGKALTKQMEADITSLIVSLSQNVRFGDAAPRIFVAAMVYLRRISLLGPRGEHLVVDERNYYRLCTVAIMMATKLYIEEHVRVNVKFADATNIPLLELNTLEIEFLHLVDFNLIVHEIDFEEMFDWIDDVGARKGIPLTHRPISPSPILNAGNSLTSPVKIGAASASHNSSSAYLLGAYMSSIETIPASTLPAASTPPAGSLTMIAGSTLPAASVGSPKLFTCKFLSDDGSPVSSPRNQKRTGGRLDDDSPALAPPSFPTSKDSCSFFSRPDAADALDDEEDLPAIDFPTFSPPPPPGDFSSDDEQYDVDAGRGYARHTLSPLPTNISYGTVNSGGNDVRSDPEDLLTLSTHSPGSASNDSADGLFADHVQTTTTSSCSSSRDPGTVTSTAPSKVFMEAVDDEPSEFDLPPPKALRASAADACPF